MSSSGDHLVVAATEFADALQAAGLRVSGLPVMDGAYHRVPVEGDKRGRKSGRYRGYLDGRPAGFIQNFKSGAEITWKFGAPLPKLSPAELNAARQAAEAAKAAAALRRIARAGTVARRCQLVFEHSSAAPDDHPYLRTKGISAAHVRVDRRGRLRVPMRDMSGRIVNLQSIDHNGRKLFQRGGQVAATHLLLGELRAGAPLLIGEGLATCETLHAATGMAVAVAFTKSNYVEIARAYGRRFAGLRFGICGDNDHHHPRRPKPLPNVGQEAAEQAARAIGGIAILPAFTPDQDGTDWNDYAALHGLHAVRDAVLAALHPPSPAVPKSAGLGLRPYYPAPTSVRHEAIARQRELISQSIKAAATRADTLKEIQRRSKALVPEGSTPAAKGAITRKVRRQVLAERGLQALPKPSRLLITGSQGSGKTSEAIKAVAEIKGAAVVWVTQPSLEKADEVAGDYIAVAGPDSMPVLPVRGRGAENPDALGTAMCPRHAVVTRAAQKGVQVRKAICAKCPLAPRCGYLRQERQIAAIGERGFFVLARNYLFLPCPAPAPDILIADEAITLAAIDDALELSPATIRDAVPFEGHRLADVMAANLTLNRLHDALQDQRPLAALRAAGVTVEHLRAAQRMLESAIEDREIAVNGEMTDAEIAAALDRLDENTAGQVLILIGAIIREMATDRDTLTAVVYQPAGVRVHRLRTLSGVHRDTSVLLLDGTGSMRLNRAIFPDLEHAHIPIERNAYITGTAGKSYSRQSITGCDRHGRKIETKAAAAAQLRAEIAEIAGAMPGPVLVGASKQAIEALEPQLPAAVAHFGNVRGLNRWQDHQSAVSVGRESISIAALEDLARAYCAEDPAPFISFAAPPPADWPWQTWPYRQTRGRRMRDGSVQPVEVEIHPDPRCQEVLEQIREAEILQFTDRIRPLFNRRHIALLNELCLDVTYDRILSHRELVAGGDRWERAWKASGILPLGAADLHRAHPDLFTSEEAARVALKRARKGGQTPNLESIWAATPLSYRRDGQRGSPSRVLVDRERHPNPRASLEVALGPLAWCDEAISDQPESRRPDTAMRPALAPEANAPAPAQAPPMAAAHEAAAPPASSSSPSIPRPPVPAVLFFKLVVPAATPRLVVPVTVAMRQGRPVLATGPPAG